MSGDPHREDDSFLQERLRELREKHSALLSRIRSDSIRLDARYQAARVAERVPKWRKSERKMGLSLMAWGAIFFVGGVIAVFGRWAVLILVVVPFGMFGGAFAVSSLLKPRPRSFDPTRYELDTAPAHLLAEYKWLDRDKEEADALAQEIQEANDLLEAQRKHDSR